MYAVTVRRDFIAQHFLTVPNPGPEGELHSHHFEVEVELAGPSLNEYGYLVDIDQVNGVLDEIESRYRDATLNELPEFEGRNPSVEHFARIIAGRFDDGIDTDPIDTIAVTVWEDQTAAATYTHDS
ncbi:MAG: 6-carboxytetrahydropterin synthase [Halobacteriales archaeon]|nr:6-carboxytetrahydropterin synthase [Halobacteriales archaeon]